MVATMKILIVINEPGFFLSHRLAIGQAAMARGFDVHVATSNGVAVKQIVALGFKHHVIDFSRSGKNIFKESCTLFTLFRLFIQIKPDLLHLVTIKPVLYGCFVARLLRIKALVVAITGLGIVFSGDKKRNFLKHIILIMYRLSLRNKGIRVIFQNKDDEATMINAGLVSKENARLIKGSGVNLADYPMAEVPDSDQIRVVMAARLLRAKGVHEFVKAARIVRTKLCNVHFTLVGEPDPGNPSSISKQEFALLRQESLVEVMGFREDIPQIFSNAHIVVLPSYYGEGLPKVLIEAAACGRPIITTDHPGCRDAVVPDITGLLVPIRDAVALAEAIENLAKDAERREKMGAAAHAFAEQNFSIERVIEQHMSIYDELLVPSHGYAIKTEL